jgi:hypothetical protein
MKHSAREAKAAVRRHVAADLEHELVAVTQLEPPRVTRNTEAVAVQMDATAEAQQARRRQPLAPDTKEITQTGRPFESDNTGRIGRPKPRTTASSDRATQTKARSAQADRGRNDDHAPPREQLDMDARARIQRCSYADAVDSRRRVVARTDTNRDGSRPAVSTSQETCRQHYSGLRRGCMSTRILSVFALVTAAALAAGCGGSSSPKIKIQAAHVYHLAGFGPTTGIKAGKPTLVSFTIVQPDGTPLTRYRHGSGPHNGVHLIIVRRDLAVIIHHHPPIGPGGKISDSVTFPAPGPYRVVIDAYPRTSGPVPNFQLFKTIEVNGSYRPQSLPPFTPSETVAGYHFTLHGTPRLHAIQALLLNFTVTGPSGALARFTPWYGALAHAVFFRAGSLDYLHTHVCAPGASGCSSVLGGARITGTSTAPGQLKVGVLLPIAGTWRLFLQCQLDGKVVTAPFTLHVS